MAINRLAQARADAARLRAERVLPDVGEALARKAASDDAAKRAAWAARPENVGLRIQSADADWAREQRAIAAASEAARPAPKPLASVLADADAAEAGEDNTARGPLVINLTPHAISIADAAGSILLTVPASGTIARRAVTTAPAGTVGVRVPAREGDEDEILDFPVLATQYGAVTGLPDPQPGVTYLVSALVLAGVQGRPDVVAPDTGAGAVRDAAGRILAVKGFVR